MEEMRSQAGLSDESAQLMVNVTTHDGKVAHRPEIACLAAGCEGCIALFSANYARVSVGLALSAIQGSMLCPNATVFVASKGMSGSVHDNEQIFYPGCWQEAHTKRKELFFSTETTVSL